MRYFPILLVAGLLGWLSPLSARAQELRCNPCSHPFGLVQVGSSSSYSFQISNTGSKMLRIASKSEQGATFSFGKFTLPMNVQPGASVELTVIFTPTARGFTVGTLTLASNDPKSPLHMHVQGTGVSSNTPEPELGVAPATLNFGNVTVGSSASLQATLTASSAAVTISSDQSNSSEYAITGLNLPVTIPAGQSVPVTIQFTPNSSGTAPAKVGFISNAANSPAIEQVTGTGVAAGSHTVDLSWNSGGGNPVGYNVYRGTTSGGPYAQINSGLDGSNNYSDDSVASGTTYYYVATEVNAEGQESAYSNVAKAVIPKP